MSVSFKHLSAGPFLLPVPQFNRHVVTATGRVEEIGKKTLISEDHNSKRNYGGTDGWSGHGINPALTDRYANKQSESYVTSVITIETPYGSTSLFQPPSTRGQHTSKLG